ncbi:MAG TPA: SDR family oxidoreductase [Bryobacteraceae bacterium]|nr:SDR family oxidoreductase [Bryobacteraceae bacterium]
MRVLVTGAQGCIGAWSVRKLLDRGVEVVTYDVNAERPRLSLIASEEELRRVEARVGSIEDTARVKALVRDGGITHIVHLAAVLMPFCQQHPVQGAMVNVIGTLNVFEAARDAGRPVRVVYASSSAVWGPGDAYESRKLNEDDPLKPATHYGVFKQSNEGNARVFFDSNGISSVGLRPWSVYGVGRDSGLTADPTLAMRALACGEPFEIRLSGHMDLQFVEDVAETFLACLFSPLEGAHVFNLAGDIVEMNELIGLLESMRPGAARLITAKGPQVPVAYRMDDSQLRAKIANIPRTPLKQGVEKTLAHFERLKAEGRLA